MATGHNNYILYTHLNNLFSVILSISIQIIHDYNVTVKNNSCQNYVAAVVVFKQS